VPGRSKEGGKVRRLLENVFGSGDAGKSIEDPARATDNVFQAAAAEAGHATTPAAAKSSSATDEGMTDTNSGAVIDAD